MEGVYKAEKEGNNERIYEEIKNVLTKDPINKEAIQRLVALRLSEGKYKECQDLLRKYLELYNESQARVQLIEIDILLNELNDASRVMDELILLEPSNFFIWNLAAEINYALKENSKARKQMLMSCKLSNYKYNRSLKEAAQILNESKEQKKQCDSIMNSFSASLGKSNDEIAKRRLRVLNQFD